MTSKALSCSNNKAFKQLRHEVEASGGGDSRNSMEE
jgi:hypothetical protein